MNNFNALLSHQGFLKHVNHAHRQCAPTPTGADSNKSGNTSNLGLEGFVATNAQKALAGLDHSTLNVRLQLLHIKVRHYEAMSKEVSKILPFADEAWRAERSLNGEVASLNTDIKRYEAEQGRRKEALQRWGTID